MGNRILKRCGEAASKVLRKGGSFFKKHKSSVYAASAIACGLGGMYAVHKAEPKALTILQQDLERKAADPNDNSISMEQFFDEGVQIEDIRKYFTFGERVKLTWPCYIQPVIWATGTVGTGAASIVTGEKAVAGLTAAVKLSEQMNDILKEETRKELGEDKYKEVEKKVEERVKATPEYSEDRKRNHGDKLIPMRDAQFGYEFMGTEDMVYAAANQAGQALINSDYCSVDTYLDILRDYIERAGGTLPRSDFAVRCSFDWDHRPEIRFGDGRWSDGTPCRDIYYECTVN